MTGGPRWGRRRESRSSWSRGGRGVDNGQASESGSWNPQKSVGFQSGPGQTVWLENNGKRGPRRGQRTTAARARGRWDLGRTGVELNSLARLETRESRPTVRVWGFGRVKYQRPVSEVQSSPTMSRAKLPPKQQSGGTNPPVQCPLLWIPASTLQHSGMESRQRRFHRACHVSRGAAPCWEVGTPWQPRFGLFSFCATHTLSFGTVQAAGRSQVLRPLSLTYGADTGLSASAAPRRVPSPAPVHHPPFFSDPARWCRLESLSSAARVARAYFQAGHLHVGTFLLPASNQFLLPDHARARPSFRCQQQPPRLQRLSLPCKPRGYPRNTPWAVVPDPIKTGGKTPGVTPPQAHTLSSSSRARPNSTRSPGTKTGGRLVAAACSPPVWLTEDSEGNKNRGSCRTTSPVQAVSNMCCAGTGTGPES